MALRLNYIDLTKSIAILCLILSHCQADIDSPIKIWIFAWHMPIFFIICGYLQSVLHPTGSDTNTFSTWIKKRFKQLLVPYIIWCIISVAFYQILKLYAGESLSVYNDLIRIVTLRGIDSMWFIPVYFLSELFYIFLVSKFSLSTKIAIGGVLLLGLVLLTDMYSSINEYARLTIEIIAGLTFVIIGGLYGELYINQKKIKNTVNITIIILTLITGSYLSHINGFSSIKLDFNNALLYYLSAFLISFSIIQLSELLCNRSNKLLSFLNIFGANSIVILCTNNIIIETFRLIEYKSLNFIFFKNGDIGAISMAIIISIIEYTIIIQCPSRLLWVFGKNTNPKVV